MYDKRKQNIARWYFSLQKSYLLPRYTYKPYIRKQNTLGKMQERATIKQVRDPTKPIRELLFNVHISTKSTYSSFGCSMDSFPGKINELFFCCLNETCDIGSV